MSLADVTIRAMAFVYLNCILQLGTNCAQVMVWLCLVANTGKLDRIEAFIFLMELTEWPSGPLVSPLFW